MRKLFFVLGIAIMLLLTACGNPAPEKIQIQLKLNEDRMMVLSQKVSEDSFIATVTRLDNSKLQSPLTVKFLNTADNIYPVINGERVSQSIIAPELREKNAVGIVQFKVYANKGNANTAEFPLNLAVYDQNNTELAKYTLTVKVN